MNWDQIREWQAAGFGVGSQTQTHPHMHRIPIEDSRRELKFQTNAFSPSWDCGRCCSPIPMANTTAPCWNSSGKQASRPLSARIPGWRTGITGFRTAEIRPERAIRRPQRAGNRHQRPAAEGEPDRAGRCGADDKSSALRLHARRGYGPGAAASLLQQQIWQARCCHHGRRAEIGMPGRSSASGRG